MADKVKLTKKPYDSALRIAANIIQYFDADGQKEGLYALRNNVHQYCEIEEKFNRLKDISKEYRENRRDLEGQSTDGGIEAAAQRVINATNSSKAFQEKVDKIQVDTSNNRNKRTFDRQLEQLISFLSVSQPASNGADDEMQIRREVNVICPISKLRMTEPMKNELCGHVYDKRSVLEMIKQNARTRCPVVGCSNTGSLKVEDLSLDIVTKIYMEKNP